VGHVGGEDHGRRVLIDLTHKAGAAIVVRDARIASE
jgi:hypothetical protein